MIRETIVIRPNMAPQPRSESQIAIDRRMLNLNVASLEDPSVAVRLEAAGRSAARTMREPIQPADLSRRIA